MATEHLENGSCVSNVRSCPIANGVGEQTWADGKYGNCALKSCNAGYQKTANLCTPSFVGKFKTPCGVETDDNNADEIFTNDTIDDTHHVLIVEVYGSSNGTCSGVLHRIVRQIGTYKRIRLSATVPGAVELDFTIPTFEVTLRSAEAVADANTRVECGKADWVINTPYTLARAACTSTPALVKTINKVDGDLLYVGSEPKDAQGRYSILNLNPARIGHRLP